jgi:hypothetical protein
VRAITVERNDSLAAKSCEMLERGGKASGKAITRLGLYAHRFAHLARQVFNIGGRAHNRDLHMIECLGQSYCVVQKASVQLSDR